MQIDSSNFDQHLDFILSQIQTSLFVAFDCEFTGLVTQLDHIEGLFPDHLEFYQRIKQTALNFSLLQLGLTVFHFEEGQYVPRAYNFYVSAPNRPRFNKLFLAEWDSMAFLAKNAMDFSHAFKNGIEYRRLFPKQGEGQNEGMCNPLQQRDFGADTIFYGKAQRETIEKLEKVVGSQQRARVDFGSKRVLDYFKGKYQISFDKGKKNMERYEYDIRVFDREEIQFEKEPKIQETSNALCEKVEEITLEQKKPIHSRTLEAVIQKIISCGKPVVGHFPNLDLGLIYHSFIAALPQTFEQFSLEVNKLFPFIFDTKVISRRLQSRMKSIKVDLKSLYKACFNKKLLQPYASINYKHVESYVQSDSSHQAGFDSFMTGCAFIAMLNYLYENKHIPFVFAHAQHENKILYSKFVGEVSLVGPQFTPKTKEYLSRILIFPGNKKDHDFQALGEALSERGTLSLHEDHGQTYYVFDQPQDILGILQQFAFLRNYSQRRVVRSREVWR